MKSVSLQLLCLMFIFSFGESFSQENLFTVMSVKGMVQSKSASGTWAKLHSGDKLKSGDKIKLAAGDYLGMVHVKGKTLELKSAGEHDITSLAQRFAKGDASFNKKFADYVANEMVSKDKSKKMTMLGAVVRSGINAIDIGIPDAVTLLEPSVKFSWYTLSTAKGYVFRLINPAGQTIYMKDTKDTSLLVNLDAMRLTSGLKYSWIVYSAENENLNSETHSIMLLSVLKKNSIGDTLNQMKNDMPDEKSAVNNFIFAKFYESNGLQLDALHCYENAYTISGGAEEYASEYGRFLADNNLSLKADEILSKINN